ncbi:FecR domain-containing protein [Sorangium sp. So ce131]|uniref:FecR domain-containing protein n=1 Tax=Sorangium sp. So ce131 TaxID=3133282 RepID=UPI003F611974
MRSRADLLSEVRAASDAGALPAERLHATRRRALVTWKSARGRRPARRLVAVFATAAALLAGGLLLLPQRPALTYVVGPGAEAGQLGAWIAVDREATPLTFSEGTVVTLASGSRARVTQADAEGASLLLERGALRARVVHASPSTRWSVQAGPFKVAVVGTEFDLAWDPDRDRLDVALHEGRVVVSGPLLDDGRTLVPGERLHVSVSENRSELSKGVPAETSPSAAATATPAASPAAQGPSPAAGTAGQDTAAGPGVAAQQPAPLAAPPAPERQRGAAAEPGWRALAAQGRYREAMAAVEREGFERVLASARASDLLELADAARHSGEFQRAREALLRARRLGARGRSAFVLGKLAADHLGAPGDAITWLQTYLDEEPGGGLAEQALGRLIELRQRRGDAAGARAAAALYLQRHPGGAYTSLAQAAAAP